MSESARSTNLGSLGPMRARLGRAAIGLLLASVALVACTDDGSRTRDEDENHAEDHGGASGELAIGRGAAEPVLPVVRGKRLFGVPGVDEDETLQGIVHAPFTATLAAPAVPDDTGRFMAYQAMEEGSPVIRVHDLRSGEDLVVARGALSPAWNEDGRLAYVKGTRARVRDPFRYRGHVVVRRTLGAEAKTWSDAPDRYVVSAWAGATLLVHRRGARWPDLVAFDGPGRPRTLARKAALIALSPDGSRALITQEPSPSPVVSIVGVDDGEVLASLDLADVDEDIAAQPIAYVGDSGSWVGDHAVAALSGGVGVFSVSSEGIAVEQILTVDPDLFPTGVLEPRLDPSGRRIMVLAEFVPRPRMAVSQNRIMECDRTTLRCRLGPFLPQPYAPRVIYNPSRP